MKHLLVFLLAVIAALAFTACNKKDTEAVPDSTDSPNENAVKKVNMFYGDDEEKVSLSKPDGAVFTLVGEDPLEPCDLVGICADDYSWEGEIMGYKYYEGIGSNRPFVDYYFAGVVTKKYDFYEEDKKDLGISFKGKPIMAIRYTYKEAGDEEKYSECFVGFEYRGSDDCGLMGVRIACYDEEPTDNQLKNLFSELFYYER